MDAAQVLIYVFFILIAVLALSALFTPIRLGLKFLINAIFGFLGLVIAGVFGDFLGISITINIFTVLLTAFLGIYGLILIIILNIFF